MLFLSSYAPLLALLAFRNRDCEGVWITLIAIAAVSVVILVTTVRLQRGQAGALLTVATWQTKDSDTLGYVASYLIPFLALDLTRTDDLVTMIAFLLVLGVVYCNSGMLYTNPVLSVLGYHAFEVTDERGQPWTLVTRRATLNRVAQLQPARVGESLIRLEA